MIFSLEFGRHSAAGQEREIVEDAVGYFSPKDELKLAQRGQLFMIADGAGLAHQGDVASQTVIKTVIHEYFEATWLDDVEQMLHNAIQKANDALYRKNVESQSQSALNCAIVCAVIHEDALYAARVGNCHAFLVSNNRLAELVPPPGDSTASAISQHIHEGAFASESENRLGLDPQIEISHVRRRIQLKDIVFLCTHNVAAAVSEDEIGLLLTSAEPVAACETLTLDTVMKFPEQDATAVAIRVKGIKRLAFDESEMPEILQTPEETEPEPRKREIVIKGVRYRENLDGEPLSPGEEEDLKRFTRGRERVSRPLKRTTKTQRTPLPWGKIIGIPLLLAVLALAGYAGYKYVPDLWRSLTEPKENVQIITADSLKEMKQSLENKQLPAADSLLLASSEQPTKPAQDTTALAAAPDTTAKQIAPPPPVVIFRVAVIDGSLKNSSINKLKSKIAAIAGSDKVSYFKSKYRIKTSKILWRKSSDARKLKLVTNRLLGYGNSFEQAFGKKSEIFPLDFSLVLGADFKMPTLRDQYMELTNEKNDYYLEILNGSKVSGLARKMSNMLHHQKFDDKRLVVVDYRNADKLTYTKSFIKCESSKNDIALKMAADFGLPTLITNAPLFDIKIIIGTDIRK
ncbi:MAG: hypothetical protein GXO74_07150 [Calditrichaeota bacterium]|nr:hypothetical protein [Calditrichota bacterium]